MARARAARSAQSPAGSPRRGRASESACPIRVDLHSGMPSRLDVSSGPSSQISVRRSTVVRTRLVEVKAGVDGPGQIECQLLAQQLGGPSFRLAERRSGAGRSRRDERPESSSCVRRDGTGFDQFRSKNRRSGRPNDTGAALEKGVKTHRRQAKPQRDESIRPIKNTKKWWRRWESNPRPNCVLRTRLRV